MGFDLGGIVGGAAGGGGTEIFSVVNTIANMASAFSANRAFNKESAGLTSIQNGLHLAPEWNQEEDLLRSDLGVGKHDYEQQQNEVRTGTASTMREASDFLTQGGMVEAMQKLYGAENKQLTQNQRENELAIEGHKKDYTSFLGEKAKAQDTLLSTGRSLDLMKLGVDQQKTADMTSFANKGAEGIDPMRMFSQLMSTPGIDKYLAAMLAKKNGGISPTGGVPPIGGAVDTLPASGELLG
jgi:hypothetical protein